MPINTPTDLEIAALSAILPSWWASQQDSRLDAAMALTMSRQEADAAAATILWAMWLGKIAASR